MKKILAKKWGVLFVLATSCWSAGKAQLVSNTGWIDGAVKEKGFWLEFGHVGNPAFYFTGKNWLFTAGYQYRHLLYDETQGPKIILSINPKLNLMNNGFRYVVWPYNFRVGPKIKWNHDEYKARLIDNPTLSLPVQLMLEQSLDADWDLFGYGRSAVSLLPRRNNNDNTRGFMAQTGATLGGGIRYQNRIQVSAAYNQMWHTITTDSRQYFETEILKRGNVGSSYSYYGVSLDLRICRLGGWSYQNELWFTASHSQFIGSMDETALITGGVRLQAVRTRNPVRERWDVNSDFPNVIAPKHISEMWFQMDERTKSLQNLMANQRLLRRSYSRLIRIYKHIDRLERMTTIWKELDPNDPELKRIMQGLSDMKKQAHNLLTLSSRLKIEGRRPKTAVIDALKGLTSLDQVLGTNLKDESRWRNKKRKRLCRRTKRRYRKLLE